MLWGFTAFILLVLWLSWSILGPVTPIKVAEETTYITEPLADDGLPDYAAYLLSLEKPAGLTPEKNGAFPFWHAMGSSYVDSELRPLLFAELGMEIPPSTGLISVFDDECYSEFEQYVSEQSDGSLNDKSSSLASLIYARFRSHRYGNDIYPFFKTIAEKNKEGIQLLLEAVEADFFYSPSPELLKEYPPVLLENSLCASYTVSKATEALAIDAMVKIVEGDKKSAWKSIQAIYLFSDHMRKKKDASVVIGVLGLEKYANRALLCLLTDLDDAGLSREIACFLDNRKVFTSMADAIIEGDTCLTVDFIIRMYSDKRIHIDSGLPTSPVEEFLKKRGVEPNKVLKYVLEWHRQYAEALREPNRPERMGRLNALNEELRESTLYKKAEKMKVAELALQFLTRHGRGELAGSELASAGLRFTGVPVRFEDDAADYLHLMRVAVSLTTWKIEHGAYPDSLDELVPDLLTEIPTCARWKRPLVYERRGKGYLLYALGANGEDDNGNDFAAYRFYNGEYNPWFIDSLDLEKIEKGDDVIVRLPVPELTLPEVSDFSQ